MNADFPVVLIDLLARTDALFSPITDWSVLGRVAGITEARADYRRRGFPYRAGGDPRRRKLLERLADRWERAGLVAFHREGERRASRRLTPTGYELARWWALASGRREALAVAAGLLDQLAAGAVYRARWVPLWSLVGWWGDTTGETTRGRVMTVLEAAEPLLSLGLAESWSDMHGMIWLSVPDPDALNKFAAEPWEPPRVTIADEPRWQRASDAHDRACDRARRWVASLRGDPRHVPIPFPVGVGPRREDAAPPILDGAGKLRFTTEEPAQ